MVLRCTRCQSAHLHLPRRSRHNARIPIVPRFRRASQQLYPLDLGVAEMLIDEEDVRGPNRLSKLGNDPNKVIGSCIPTSQWQSRVLKWQSMVLKWQSRVHTWQSRVLSGNPGYSSGDHQRPSEAIRVAISGHHTCPEGSSSRVVTSRRPIATSTNTSSSAALAPIAPERARS